MPVLMYHEGVLNQGVKHPKWKKVYHKVVVIQWICLLKKYSMKWNLTRDWCQKFATEQKFDHK